jgi:hypothetical protein
LLDGLQNTAFYGISQRNPGQAGARGVLMFRGRKIVFRKDIGYGSNNLAKLWAAVLVMKIAREVQMYEWVV